MPRSKMDRDKKWPEIPKRVLKKIEKEIQGDRERGALITYRDVNEAVAALRKIR
jgi:hypothetical protein